MAELLVGLLREQLEEVDKLVRDLSSLSDDTEIERLVQLLGW